MKELEGNNFQGTHSGPWGAGNVPFLEMNHDYTGVCFINTGVCFL